jgi:predicted double-glycine peptidase
MTTYIKRFNLVPINTFVEYEEAIENELLALEDLAASIEDIARVIEDRDENALFFEEVRSLKREAQDLYDTASNLTKLVEDYATKLAAESISGPGE